MDNKPNKSIITICTLFITSIVLVNAMQSCVDNQMAESKAAKQLAESERYRQMQEYADKQRVSDNYMRSCRAGNFC